MTVAPLWLWAVDREGRYTMSAGKLAIFGMNPNELVGVSSLEVFTDIHPEIVEAMGRVLGGEECRTVTSPSHGVEVETWYVPLRGAGGELSGATGISMDASDRFRTERELREKLDVIARQSSTIRALASPVIQVWDQVLCLPVIGTVDGARTAEMMEGLLESIVREQARYAIVDLTGVEVVDTSTADHLIQLFRAARVLGVEGILCGIRPPVAQTVVALGLELGSVKTMRSLRDALKWCIRARAEDA